MSILPHAMGDTVYGVMGHHHWQRTLHNIYRCGLVMDLVYQLLYATVHSLYVTPAVLDIWLDLLPTLLTRSWGSLTCGSYSKG